MRRIYARKTEVKEIDPEIADEFIKKYHRQGLTHMGTSRIDFGIFYQNELVGEVSFDSPRTRRKAKEYQMELIRMTFKSDVQVIGGASKMIKYYINHVKPRNFFTYQTTSGNNSKVYESAGMHLVQKGKPKYVLVKNGYTYNSAINEYAKKGTKFLYLNAQLVNYGPDHILGTHLGEEFNNDGTRKTNKELFLEYCNYHEETIPGDNVYVYENPKYYYYIYEMTNNDPADNHYYIGRHSQYSEHPLTKFDFLTDGYSGSGGIEFQQWKNKTIHGGYNFIKTILKTPSTWTETVKAEGDMIGNRYQDDDNCLNVKPGGIDAGSSLNNIWKQYQYDNCQKHGYVMFKNGKCIACQSDASLHNDICDKHGLTLFNGHQCLKCLYKSTNHVACCPIHGKTSFQNMVCRKCLSDKTIKIKRCSTHGLTPHRNGKCMKCWVKQSMTQKECPIHGKTTFHGDTCMQCINSNTIYIDICEKHGKTKFKGGQCCKCIAEKTYSQKTCPIHGKTTFAGDICLKCKNNNSVTERWCNKCQKVTRFNGNTCMSCVNRNMYHMKKCPIHGMTKFRSNTCMKCSATKRPKKPKKVHITERKYCDKCDKVTRHVDGQCMSCVERSLYHQDTCPIHGMTKFRGHKCCACRAAKMREQRRLKKLQKQKN